MYTYLCMYVQVECQSVEEACEAASAGADIVMLDNFNTVRNAVHNSHSIYSMTMTL